MKIIDAFLNSITMYSLVFYELAALIGIAVIISFFGLIPYTPMSILVSTSYLVLVSWITNEVFSRTFKAPTNIESVYITAFILVLIISPIRTIHDLIFLTWVAVWSMGSKYIFAIGKKHIFNPAAIAVLLTSIFINQSANWWVGTTIMAPFVLVGGLLIVRKMQRENLIFSFFFTSVLTIAFFVFIKNGDVYSVITKIFFQSAIFFFAFIMLTEPLTTPPTKKMQIIYGGLVGFLFTPQMHIGNVYSTPELALIIGNIFSYFVSPKQKLLLYLKQKIQVTPSLMDFIFFPNKKLTYLPGQYMEWTIPLNHTDSRGNRRYFTLASSPTENNLRLGIKFYDNGSSFKKALANSQLNTLIVASQLAGDFILPIDKNKKLVFLAGGIGITPFRSMIKFLTDKNEKRQITLFYANKTKEEIIYTDVFNDAQQKLGIKTVYTLTDENHVPINWQGRRGRVSKEMIMQEVPSYDECLFYLSGPRSMVMSFNNSLKELGIKEKNIKIDYFPGFA